MAAQTLILFIAIQAILQLSMQNCMNGDLNLLSVTSTNESIDGPVQLCYHNAWWKISYYDLYTHTRVWTNVEANIACRQLGCAEGEALRYNHDCSYHDNRLKVNCSVESTVQSIMNCSITSLYCYYIYYIAGISCQKQAPPSLIDIEAEQVQSTSLAFIWSPQNSSLCEDTQYYTFTCQSVTIGDSRVHIRTIENATITNITELQPYSHYNCCVSAWNAIGNSEQVCTNATTLPLIPEGVQNFTAQNISFTSAGLHWITLERTFGEVEYTITCYNPSDYSNAFHNHTDTSPLLLQYLTEDNPYSCCISAANTIRMSSTLCINFTTESSPTSPASTATHIIPASVPGAVPVALGLCVLVAAAIIGGVPIAIIVVRKKNKQTSAQNPENKQNPTPIYEEVDDNNSQSTSSNRPMYSNDYSLKCCDIKSRSVDQDESMELPAIPSREYLKDESFMETELKDMINAIRPTIKDDERTYQPSIPAVSQPNSMSIYKSLQQVEARGIKEPHDPKTAAFEKGMNRETARPTMKDAENTYQPLIPAVSTQSNDTASTYESLHQVQQGIQKKADLAVGEVSGDFKDSQTFLISTARPVLSDTENVYQPLIPAVSTQVRLSKLEDRKFNPSPICVSINRSQASNT